MKLTTKSILLLFLIAMSSMITVESKRKSVTKRSKAKRHIIKAKSTSIIENLNSTNMYKFFFNVLREVFAESLIMKIIVVLKKAAEQILTPGETKWEYQLGKTVKCDAYPKVGDAFRFLLEKNLDLPKVKCTDIKKEELEDLKKNCGYLDSAVKSRTMAQVNAGMIALGSVLLGFLTFGVSNLANGIVEDEINSQLQDAGDKVDYAKSVITFSVSSPSISQCFSGISDVKEVCSEANKIYDDEFKPKSERYSWHNYLIAAIGSFGYLRQCSLLGAAEEALKLLLPVHSVHKFEWSEILEVAGKFLVSLLKTLASIAIDVGMIAYYIYRAIIAEDVGIKFESWGRAVGKILKIVINVLAPGSLTKRKMRLAPARRVFRLKKN